jgi:hypothetical protein
VMDEFAVPLVRADGTALNVTVMLGSETKVWCDDDHPPYLVIESGQVCVLLEVCRGDDPRGLAVAAGLAAAAQAFYQRLARGAA